jgi:DNA modification methylase
LVKFLHWIPYDYYFDQQKDVLLHNINSAKFGGALKHDGYGKSSYSGNPYNSRDYEDKNMRDVWWIAYEPIKEKHFAPFPTKLVKTPIQATCPEWVCTKCGLPKIKAYKPKYEPKTDVFRRELVGYAKCDCGAPFRKGLTYDPFMGSGTTGLVALQLGRNFVGTELSPEYKEIAERRIAPHRGVKRLEDF